VEILRVYRNSRLDDISVEDMNEEQLRRENEGYDDFVQAVLAGLRGPGIYDDSDYGEGVLCLYLRKRTE